MVWFPSSLSGLDAFGSVMNSSANNLANVNTNNYKATSVSLETSLGGDGVRVAGISRDTSFGPAVISENSLREKLSAENQFTPSDNSNETSRLEVQDDANNGGVNSVYGNGYIEGSNTDISREFVTMISTESAYTANTSVIRTEDEMSGTLIDMIT